MNTKRFVLSLALLLALVAPAFASKKDDLYKQAQEAANAGRLQEATNLYCQVAQMDSGYKDAALNCKIMTDQLKKEAAYGDERFNSGVADFNAGRYDDAEQKFRNVRAGAHVADAKDYLQNRIPQARAAAAQAKNAAAQESAMAQKFDQAVQAYKNNDFATAKALFSQITGNKQGDAQYYLGKMKQYEDAMNDGDRLASAGNYKQAISSYNEAAAIKSDGPNDPRGRAQRAQQLMASAGRTGGTTTTTTASTGNTTVQPRREIASAVVDTRPKVDVAKMMRDADAARKAGNIPDAIGKYTAVVSADPTNAQAKIALEQLKDQLKQQETASGAQSLPKASSDADVMLVKAIGEYYSGDYEQAEVHIQDYLDVNGSKTALSYFYLGASKLTRYYLNGAQDNDRRLMKEAQDAFRQAKQIPGFQPPDRYVSPKILKVYQGT